MTTLVSQRHFFKFYLTIIFGSIFFLAMATGLLLAYDKEVSQGSLELKEQLMPVFSIACYILTVYSIYRYIKNAPTIKLNNETISFNNTTFNLSDIDTIELTGKRPFKYVLNFPMEAATLTFRSDETKYIFDDMYSNSWQLKLFLNDVVIKQQDFFEPTQYAFDERLLDNEFFETYKGTVITSLRGISAWGLIVFFCYSIMNSSKPVTLELLFFFFCFSAFWLLVHTRVMNYFQVSDNYLVVRNHHFFWSKKIYPLQSIKEVVFETSGKMPNCLRIITSDFRNKLYPAGTLRNKTWLELKDTLETFKIKVRNECIPE